MGCLTSSTYGVSNGLMSTIYHRRGPPSAPFATDGVAVEKITGEEVELGASTSAKAPLIAGIGKRKGEMKKARFIESDFVTPIPPGECELFKGHSCVVTFKNGDVITAKLHVRSGRSIIVYRGNVKANPVCIDSTKLRLDASTKEQFTSKIGTFHYPGETDPEKNPDYNKRSDELCGCCPVSCLGSCWGCC